MIAADSVMKFEVASAVSKQLQLSAPERGQPFRRSWPNGTNRPAMWSHLCVSGIAHCISCPWDWRATMRNSNAVNISAKWRCNQVPKKRTLRIILKSYNQSQRSSSCKSRLAALEAKSQSSSWETEHVMCRGPKVRNPLYRKASIKLFMRCPFPMSCLGICPPSRLKCKWICQAIMNEFI